MAKIVLEVNDFQNGEEFGNWAFGNDVKHSKPIFLDPQRNSYKEYAERGHNYIVEVTNQITKQRCEVLLNYSRLSEETTKFLQDSVLEGFNSSHHDLL